MGIPHLHTATSLLEKSSEHTSKMSLSTREKKLVQDFLAKTSGQHNEMGSEALARLMVVFPSSKSYFAHWKDLSKDSVNVRKHGIVIMNGVYDALAKIDDMNNGLLTLSELHAFMLRIDPINFKYFIHCILVTMAMMFPDDFTPQVHVAIDKFLALVAMALQQKYR